MIIRKIVFSLLIASSCIAVSPSLEAKKENLPIINQFAKKELIISSLQIALYSLDYELYTSKKYPIIFQYAYPILMAALAYSHVINIEKFTNKYFKSLKNKKPSFFARPENKKLITLCSWIVKVAYFIAVRLSLQYAYYIFPPLLSPSYWNQHQHLARIYYDPKYRPKLYDMLHKAAGLGPGRWLRWRK